MSRGKAPRGDQPGGQQVQIPITKQLTFLNCVVEVQKADGGGRVLQILDPAAGTIYLLPMGGEVARKIGNELFSAVPIAPAGSIPPHEERDAA